MWDCGVSKREMQLASVLLRQLRAVFKGVFASDEIGDVDVVAPSAYVFNTEPTGSRCVLTSRDLEPILILMAAQG